LSSSWGSDGFEGVVEGEEEFSHHGSQGQFVWFAFGAQTLIKVGEDWVVTGGDQCGHVEAAAQSASSTEDGALAA